MKLNIGCGYNYLRGYVNLDASRDSLADKFMEAHQLGFDDGSAEEIKASQLIEHLGFFRTKYFLAECYRVLKDGGVLTLETPHIEKTFRPRGPRSGAGLGLRQRVSGDGAPLLLPGGTAERAAGRRRL
ncbi:MAG: methyltransferase domain-containing protein [Elusimicrobia bacterium]|nr:methyltransferase domain-containing protein [Elusimicrobiota bacterium]